jgi:hypothetical protein
VRQLLRHPAPTRNRLTHPTLRAHTGPRLLDRFPETGAGLISNHSVFEGMAIFRHPNGTYYMMTSHLTGWNPNPLMLFRAQGKTLDDPQWFNMGT